MVVSIDAHIVNIAEGTAALELQRKKSRGVITDSSIHFRYLYGPGKLFHVCDTMYMDAATLLFSLYPYLSNVLSS